MKRIIENIKFMQDGTMVFGDLHLEDGFVERIDHKIPYMVSDIAIPGLMDIHTHGFHGYSCENIDIGNLHTLALEYPKHGITSFCPTVSTRSLDEFRTIIDAYRKAFQGGYRGACYEGVHLEGLYLNPDRRGSMKKENLMETHLGGLEDFLSEYHDSIKTMIIAPDVKNAMEAISLLHLYGIEISLGHTNADFTQTNEALVCGTTQITHLGDTVPEITHHKPDMIDAVFLSGCLCEVIINGVHMQKEMPKWVIRLLSCSRVVAVSDGMPFSGFHYPDGYELEDGSVIRNGAVYKEGILLGSSCDLLNIFQYLYKQEGYDLSDCIRICSTNAARILKTYAHEIGLRKNINLVILGYDMRVKEVIINGRSAL